ncbi:MAG TPA: ribonuclease P protein component [Methylophilus sp.]|nr:ribonuclease P protein component [Methylophilus sp.]HQQ32324.1 ribonuclease P protein component [Methylophilus sp.]
MPKLTTLAKTDDFSSVFSFKKRQSANFLVIHYRLNHLSVPRVGLTVSKRVANLAVDRNYMRRVLREVCRQAFELPTPLDYVIQVRKRFGRKEFLAVKEELLMLLAKIQVKIEINQH